MIYDAWVFAPDQGQWAYHGTFNSNEGSTTTKAFVEATDPSVGGMLFARVNKQANFDGSYEMDFWMWSARAGGWQSGGSNLSPNLEGFERLVNVTTATYEMGPSPLGVWWYARPH